MTPPDDYRAGGIVYRRARQEDDANLRALLRDNPMPGWVRMTLERAPSYFAGEGIMGESETVFAHLDDESAAPVGMYHCAFLPMHIDGEPREAAYLGGLRVAPPYRHKLRILRRGYDSIPVLTARRQPKLWMTSIAADNRPALRLLEAGLKGMPRYRPLAELETLVISTRHGRQASRLRRAAVRDIPALVAFYNRHARHHQFSPVLGEAWLRKLDGRHGLTLKDFYLLEEGAEMTGCLALWDQRGYKQVVARGYRFPVNLLRRPYNLWAGCTGRPLLPAPGNALQSLYLAFALFPPEPAAALTMLREALHEARRKKIGSAVLGISPQHPLRGRLVKTFKPHIYRTRIETVSWGKDEPAELDPRPVQPEVALL